MHLYEQALVCVGQLPSSRDLRQRGIDLRIHLAQVAFYVQPGHLLEWLQQAEVEAGQLQDAERLTRVRLAQASALYILGDITNAPPRLEQLHVMAASRDDRLLEAQTDNVLGRLLAIRGELSRGLTLLERALRAAEPDDGAAWSPAPLERIASLGLAATACAFRGKFDEANSWLERCRQVPHVKTDAASEAATDFCHALVTHTYGDWSSTTAHVNQAIVSARSGGNLIYEYVAHVYLGPALAHQGRIAEGLAVQQAELTLADRAHTRVILGQAYAYQAEILMLAGELDAAGDAVRQGLALAEQHGHLLETAIGARVRGEILARLGHRDEAITSLERARSILAALEAWPEWARAEAALGRMLLIHGNHEQGRQHLERAAQRFADMGVFPDHTRVRELLAPRS